MVKAYISYTKYGYVVWVKIFMSDDSASSFPTRCFGDYKSAAMEFRDFIKSNNMDPYKFERMVWQWAQTFDPEVKYTYPEINAKRTMVTLRKQKGGN